MPSSRLVGFAAIFCAPPLQGWADLALRIFSGLFCDAPPDPLGPLDLHNVSIVDRNDYRAVADRPESPQNLLQELLLVQ